MRHTNPVWKMIRHWHPFSLFGSDRTTEWKLFKEINRCFRIDNVLHEYFRYRYLKVKTMVKTCSVWNFKDKTTFKCFKNLQIGIKRIFFIRFDFVWNERMSANFHRSFVKTLAEMVFAWSIQSMSNRSWKLDHDFLYSILENGTTASLR